MINFISGIESTASALHAERIRTEIASENISHALNSAKGADGKIYQRKSVVFESVLAAQNGGPINGTGAGNEAKKVQVARILEDQRPPRMIPAPPGHPDADANGMISVPNVNIHEEMADLIVSGRAYEANLAVVRNARSMALQTLNIGKR